jgi:hypothetical protein
MFLSHVHVHVKPYPCKLKNKATGWTLQLFSESGLEDADLSAKEGLANHMGLFLQKTNIIRDYLEDINELPAPRHAQKSLFANCFTLSFPPLPPPPQPVLPSLSRLLVTPIPL